MQHATWGKAAACGFFILMRIKTCLALAPVWTWFLVTQAGHKATTASPFLWPPPPQSWYLQRTYIRGERLNILGLALARPALLTRRLRQSGDDMRCGHKDARRNNTTTGIRVRTRGVIVRRSKLRAIRIAGTHARRGGVSLPRYAIVSSVKGMLQHIVWIVHGHYPTLHYAPAIDGGIDDAILIPLGERRVADIAAEAVHMKDQVPGAHHQLVGANGGQAAGTAACNKKTAGKRKKSNLIIKFIYLITNLR